MITIGVLTGPWHVGSNLRPGQMGYWFIVNMLDGKSKKIGKVRRRQMKGTNYFDRAKEVAHERNKAFLDKHMADKSLPKFLGINPEFDKTIEQCLQGGRI
jgi:hypothetical protein